VKLPRVTTYVAAAMLTVGAIGAGVATAHTKRFTTTVTIEAAGSPSGDSFSGDVDSRKNACLKNRKVTIIREQGDQEVGSDRTNGDGHYVVDIDGFVQPGDYYAKVKKKVLKRNNEHKHICKKATSDTASVGPH